FSSRRRHARWPRDWSSDVCSSDLAPSLRRRGSTPIRDGWLLLVAAARARALVATAAGACLADHAEILSRPAPVEVRAARTVTTNPQNLRIMPCKGGCRSSTGTPAVRPCSWVHARARLRDRALLRKLSERDFR